MNQNKQPSPYTNLLIAAGSLVFYTMLVPILDTASTYIQNQFNLRNVKLQAEAQKVQESIQNQGATHAIGFAVPSEEERYENE